MLLNKLVSEEPDATFPESKYTDCISHACYPFLVNPDQKIIHSVNIALGLKYYEMAKKSSVSESETKRDVQKAEYYFEKEIQTSEENSDFKNMSYYFLLDLYRNVGLKEKLCSLIDQILSKVKNDFYVLPFDCGEGESGRLMPEALLTKVGCCAKDESEKKQLLRKLVLPKGEKRIFNGQEWFDCNRSGDYYELAIYLGDESFCRELLKDESIKNSHGFVLNIKLAQIFLLKGDKSTAKKYWKDSIKYVPPTGWAGQFELDKEKFINDFPDDFETGDKLPLKFLTDIANRYYLKNGNN